MSYEKQRKTFLGSDQDQRPVLGDRREYSEATAETMDREVRAIVTAALDRAEQILDQDRELLETMAERLLDEEVIDRDGLDEILAASG